MRLVLGRLTGLMPLRIEINDDNDNSGTIVSDTDRDDAIELDNNDDKMKR